MSVPNPMKGRSGFNVTATGDGGSGWSMSVPNSGFGPAGFDVAAPGGSGGSGYATTIAPVGQSMGMGQTQAPMPDGMWLHILLLEVRACWTFRFLPRDLRDRIIAALNGDTP